MRIIALLHAILVTACGVGLDTSDPGGFCTSSSCGQCSGPNCGVPNQGPPKPPPGFRARFLPSSITGFPDNTGISQNWAEVGGLFSLTFNGGPLFRNPGLAPLSGPAIQFVGSPDHFQQLATLPFGTFTGLTIVAVANTTSATKFVAISDGATVSSGNYFYLGNTSGNQAEMLAHKNAQPDLLANQPATLSAWHLYVGEYDPVATSTFISIDGANLSASSPNGAYNFSPAFSAGSMLIGAVSGAVTGQLAEVFVYDRVLNSAEIAILKDYSNDVYHLGL